MALLIMLDLVVAQKFGDEMALADRLDSRSDHATLGMIVAVLFTIRLFLRFRHGAPAFSAGAPAALARAARATHLLMYFLIGFLILSGIATAMTATNSIELFGRLDISVGLASESSFAFLRNFHEFATNAIILLITLHFIAALYHQFIVKDNGIVRMLKFWQRVS